MDDLAIEYLWSRIVDNNDKAKGTLFNLIKNRLGFDYSDDQIRRQINMGFSFPSNRFIILINPALGAREV